MSSSILEQGHTVSLCDAIAMPRFKRLGGYADEQNPGNG